MTEDVALLLRRAGFGPTAAELAAAAKVGYAATVMALTAPRGPDIGATSAPAPQLGPDPYAVTPNPTPARRAAADKVREEQTEQLTRWWLDRLTVANHQAVEKLLFFWHGHWATSIRKVKSPQLMLTQHQTLRHAPNFAEMARRMVVDPALVHWLDGQLNTREAPNENLARELCELFLLGIGRYTEADVKAAGRALTGWRLDLRAERTVLDRDAHDAGSKVILGVRDRFTARGLVDLLLRQPACAEFIATRLWFRYASSTEPIPGATRDRMVAAFPAPMAMLRALFTDDAFRATHGTMVKQPVEWMVGAMRQLGLRPADFPREMFIQLCDGLGGLGQRPFAPPSVGGWPAGAAWLTSAAARLKLSLAGKLASQLELGRLTPEDVAAMLCVDRWTNRTYAVLRKVDNPRMLLTMGLVSPEYAVT
ncbi:Uncharacterized conserved protein, DUF1800 family [Micromonospora viridifaciens]|uniref:Uncharacterized conserved protein, DUF1800 family n=1 Tax=Micromonospora viridifaciens TaxID=1881 RepID=A0A1C4ZKS2_MICVI|nr:DUF1800 family protein [Micromonospora viridifaciens]SCF33515.1 Uncharacterized conserved protein, DUF1800 family [Micromonospora viridifaciens]